jgi:iron complex outermembrane receptor protein
MSIFTPHVDAGETGFPSGTREARTDIQHTWIAGKAARWIIAASATLIAMSVVAFGENISGRILDPEGNSVADAQVRLFDRNGGDMRSTVSSKEGIYGFQSIPAGTYLIEADSFGTLRGSQEVSVKGDEKLDLKLEISGTRTDVLVTASGTSLSGDEVSKALDVVDSDDIDLRDEFSISEAVRNIPGLRVQTQEGPGSFTTIQTRGLRAQDTAVLIDGMRFRDAASISGDATSFLGDMNIIDTERIEVLRGSGSSLYGSNALGGVINITSRPGGGPTHGSFLTEGGGLGMIRSVFTIGGGVGMDRFTYSAGASHLNVTKGPRDGLPYRSTGTQGSARYNFTPNISLSGKIWYSNNYLASTESPIAITANSPAGGEVKAIALPLDQLELFENKQPFNAGSATYIPNQIDPDARLLSTFWSGGLTFQHQISKSSSYHITYQGVQTKRGYLDGPAGPGSFEPSTTTKSNFNGYIRTVQARFDQRVGGYNFVSIGYEYEGERYDSFNGDSYTTSSTSDSIRLEQGSNALYFQDQIRLFDSKLQLTVGGRAQFFRLDDPVFAGSTTPYTGVDVVKPPTAYTGDGAFAYFISGSNTKLRGHVGNSFRAPSGYERFGGGFGSYYGDPRLSPERSIGVDGGIDQKLMHSKVTLSATWFYTALQQTILFANSLPAGDPYGRFFGYANGGGGMARGVELGGHYSPTSRTNLGMSYTYVNSDSRTPTISGTQYYKVLDLSPHAFTLTATQWLGSRTNVSFDMSALSDYTTTISGGGQRQFVFNGPTKADVVFHYDYPLSDRHAAEFYVKVENIFNQRAYEDGFIGPKAWAIAGIKFKY